MPISGNTHSLPAGVLVTNGQISDATQHNPGFTDLSASITTALTRTADHIAETDPHSQYERKVFTFSSVAVLQADTAITYTGSLAGSVVAGDFIRTKAEGYSYQVAASAASDHHVATPGGVKLYCRTATAKAFWVKGDGVADDTSALQKAFNAFKKIIFEHGTYVYSSLTLNDYQHLQGQGFHQGAAPSNASVILKHSGTSGNSLTCGHNPLIENIYFLGSGVYNETTKALGSTTAQAIKLLDDVTLNNVSFALFRSCVVFGTGSYYVKTANVEFNRCTNGYVTDGTAPYNVDIKSPISRLTDNFFTGQALFPARNIKIFGGSIEGFFTLASGFLDLSMFGVYIETIVERDGAFAIDPGVNGCSVSLFGNLVYLNHIARFVNLSALSNAQLGGYGNVYDGAGRAASIIYYLPSTGGVNLSGDRFGAGHPNDLLYVDSITNALKFNGITMPLLPAANSHGAYSGVQFIGNRGFLGLRLSSAPSGPVTGMTVLADGSSWDPLTRAAGRPYWTVWQGDRWRSPGGGA